MSNFTIEIIGDEALQQALHAASADIERVTDTASDDAREPLGTAFWHETHVMSGDLRDANELIAGPGFRVTLANFMPYASFEDDRHHFVARSVERGERGVLRVYEQAVDAFTTTFGDD